MTHHAAAASSKAVPHREDDDPVTLRRLRVAWLDRILPERTGPFLAVVAAVSVACWLAGLLLAQDRARFLASHEWQAQPLYLAVHLVVVRLFVNAYAGEYLAGCRALVMKPAEAERRTRFVLGPAGFVAALVLAAPFAVHDVLLVHSADFVSDTTVRGGPLGAADWLLVAVWTAEWIANAYVWVVILGFLAASLHALNKHAFRAPVLKVLRERHYRPFLLMSARGATIVLVFALASGLYVLYAKGETSDYVGLWVTAGLLVAGFVPPWMRLRSRITALVHAETDRLGDPADAAIEEAGGTQGELEPPRTLEEIGERVQVTLAYLRIEHLERLHQDMGKLEAQTIFVRLLAPIATVVWRLTKG